MSERRHFRPPPSVIVPAPGDRNSYSGTLSYIGNSGYSYSSTSHTSNDHYRGMYLSFRTTALSASGSYHRANGLPLRCLSE